MRITFLINRDLAATLALNYLLPKLRQHQIRVFFTQKPLRHEPPIALQSLIEFEQLALSKLADTQGSVTAIENIEHLCGSAAQKLNDVNNQDYDRLRETAPDVIVSIRHMSILKEQVINMPANGVLNLHSGLLPKYQGVMSSFRALQNKESELGSTLHFIEDRQIDRGSIISLARVESRFDKSYLWNMLNLYHSGCEMILQALKQIEEREVITSQAQEGESNYFSYPTTEEFEAYKQAGMRLFDKSDLVDFNMSI